MPPDGLRLPVLDFAFSHQGLGSILIKKSRSSLPGAVSEQSPELYLPLRPTQKADGSVASLRDKDPLPPTSVPSANATSPSLMALSLDR
jgi:hypothetical protein